MSSAREMAVRVLADYDARHADNEVARAHRCAAALRALLAALPAEPVSAKPQTIIETICWVLNDAHYKAPEQIAGLWREVWAPMLREAVDAMPVGTVPVWDREAAPSLPDAVREAAERLREAFPNYTAMSADCDCPTCLTMRLLSALDARRRG